MRLIRTVKGQLKRGIRKGQRLVQSFDSGNFSNPDFAYAELNAALLKFMEQDPSTLRASYTWGVLQGAHLARALGMNAISVAEFGVAGGNGLVALERAAEKTQALLGVTIEVHGFDTGRGLPRPTDHRDHPNTYTESTYQMDEPRLRARLRTAQLHLGLVQDTVPEFLASRPAPLACISFDLDHYTSTMAAFAVLEANEALLLPRVHCYFDDIMGFTCSEFAGERLAINEFNTSHATRKISPIFGLCYFLPPAYAAEQWSEMFYLAHIFDHRRYGDADGMVVRAERPLTGPAAHRR